MFGRSVRPRKLLRWCRQVVCSWSGSLLLVHQCCTNVRADTGAAIDKKGQYFCRKPIVSTKLSALFCRRVEFQPQKIVPVIKKSGRRGAHFIRKKLFSCSLVLLVKAAWR